MAGFFKNLFNKFADKAEIDWDELEADLISADLGMKMTSEIMADLRALGRSEEARPYLQEAVQEDPSDAEARRQLAGLLRADGEVEAALDVLEAGVEGAPALRCELGRMLIAYTDEDALGRAELEACWEAGGTLTSWDISALEATDSPGLDAP